MVGHGDKMVEKIKAIVATVFGTQQADVVLEKTVISFLNHLSWTGPPVPQSRCGRG